MHKRSSAGARRAVFPFLVASLLGLSLWAHASGARETTLILYRGDVAVVEQRQRHALDTGRQTIEFDGLPPELATGSVRVRAADAEVRGQRLVHRPVTPARLMEAHVGAEVRLRRDRARRAETVTVVSADPPLVRGRHGIEQVDPADLVFPGLPDGLGPDGRLLVDFEVASGGDRDVQVAYVLPGLGWSVDYDAVVDVAADTLEVVARATLENRRAVAFADARIGLVAGELHLPDAARRDVERAVMTMAAEDAAPAEAVGDYHLFRLDEPVDVPAEGHVTVPLFARAGADAERHYAVDGGPGGGPGPLARAGDGWQTAAVDARLSWRNAGGPMPAGTVRVYRRDGEGNERLVGGGAVDDTPEGERIRLVPGRPFDITAQRRQIEFRRIDDRSYESAHEIRVRNARDSEVEVVVEARPRGDWEMVDSSDDWEQRAAELITWTVTVPARGERVVSYRFRARR